MTNLSHKQRRDFAREWGEALAHQVLHGDEVRAGQNKVYWGRWLTAHGITPEEAQDLVLERMKAFAETMARAA